MKFRMNDAELRLWREFGEEFHQDFDVVFESLESAPREIASKWSHGHARMFAGMLERMLKQCSSADLVQQWKRARSDIDFNTAQDIVPFLEVARAAFLDRSNRKLTD